MTTANTSTQRRRTLGGWLRDSRLASTAIDDRGHKVRLLDPVRLKDAAATHNPAAAARLAWARAEMRAGNFGLRWGLVMFLCWVAVPVLDGNDAPAVVWGVVLPVWLVLVWRLSRLIARRGNAKRNHRVGSLLASHGLCPTCAYSLADLAPEPDGCTVCPECGGAWSMGANRDAGSRNTEQVGVRPLLHLPRPRENVRDSRGDRHAAIQAPMRALLVLRWSPSQLARLKLALEEARQASRRNRRSLAATHLFLGVLLLAATIYLGGQIARATILSPGTPALVAALPSSYTIVPLTLVVLGVVMTGHFFRQAHTSMRSDEWISYAEGRSCLSRHGFCAACFNDLSGLIPDPDGCTVCPECGAAWKLPPEPRPAQDSP